MTTAKVIRDKIMKAMSDVKQKLHMTYKQISIHAP